MDKYLLFLMFVMMTLVTIMYTSPGHIHMSIFALLILFGCVFYVYNVK